MENKNLERSADNLKSDLHAFVNNFASENILGHKTGLALSSDCDQVVNDLIEEVERVESEAEDVTRYTSKISDLEWEVDHLQDKVEALRIENLRIEELEEKNEFLTKEVEHLKQELESI